MRNELGTLFVLQANKQYSGCVRITTWVAMCDVRVSPQIVNVWLNANLWSAILTFCLIFFALYLLERQLILFSRRIWHTWSMQHELSFGPCGVKYTRLYVHILFSSRLGVASGKLAA